MATWNTTNKSATPVYTQPSESSSDFGLINQIKGGLGWLYDQANITYDGATDPISGNTVYYDGLGVVASWTNQNKS